MFRVAIGECFLVIHSNKLHQLKAISDVYEIHVENKSEMCADVLHISFDKQGLLFDVNLEFIE